MQCGLDHLKRGEFTVAKIAQTTLEALPVAPRTAENSPCVCRSKSRRAWSGHHSKAVGIMIR
jgi:hypothetical protein